MKRLAIASIALSAILFSGCGGSNSGIPSSNNTNRQSDVQITKVNHTPVATLSTLNIARNVSYDGQLTATDEDGDMLKYVIVDKPKHGTVILHDDGCFTYTPNKGYQGTDTFSYKARDDVSSCKVKEVTVHIKEPTVQIPKAPTNLTIKALSTTKLELHWEDNADNEKCYVIYRDGKPVCTTKANATSAIISCGLKAGRAYTFEVRAQNEAGRSAPATATGTTKDVTTPPKAPTNLKAKAVAKTSLRLTWEDNADNESGYEIYQDGKLLKTISPNCHCTVVKDLEEATTYEFVVKAINKIGKASSNKLTVSTLSSKPTTGASGGSGGVGGGTTQPDTTKPTITLKDTKTVTIIVGDSYTDAGATATDDRDGDITSKIQKSGDVDTNKVGTYSITYTVSDSAGNKADPVTRTVIVNEKPNTAPTATPQSLSMRENSILHITLSGTDADGDTLTYAIVSQSSHGTVVLNGNKVTYTPNENYNGSDSFTFKVNDGKVDSAPATVNVEANPVVIGSFEMYNLNVYNFPLSKDETKVYVANGGNGMMVLDISDPTNPKKIGSLDESANSNYKISLSKDEAKAFVLESEDGGVVAVDVSNPANPKIVNYLQYGADFVLSKDKTKMFVAGLNDGMLILDVSDPANSKEIGSFNNFNYPYAITLSNDETKAIVAVQDEGIVVLDVSDPTNPKKVGSFDTDGYFNGWVRDITLLDDDTKAFVSNSDDGGIIVLDISDPTNPKKIGSFDTDGVVYNITFSKDGTKAFIANGHSGIVVFDVSDPINPKKISSFDTDGSANNIILSDDETKAFVADGNGGVKIIDLSLL